MNIALFTNVACEPRSGQTAFVVVPAVDRSNSLNLTSDVSCTSYASEKCREYDCELHVGGFWWLLLSLSFCFL